MYFWEIATLYNKFSPKRGVAVFSRVGIFSRVGVLLKDYGTCKGPSEKQDLNGFR